MSRPDGLHFGLPDHPVPILDGPDKDHVLALVRPVTDRDDGLRIYEKHRVDPEPLCRSIEFEHWV